jgi:hypothetical protein
MGKSSCAVLTGTAHHSKFYIETGFKHPQALSRDLATHPPGCALFGADATHAMDLTNEEIR